MSQQFGKINTVETLPLRNKQQRLIQTRAIERALSRYGRVIVHDKVLAELPTLRGALEDVEKAHADAFLYRDPTAKTWELTR